MRHYTYAYAVVYDGNHGHALCGDTLYASRREAREAAARLDGSGLHYGARVKRIKVTREDIARHDAVREYLRIENRRLRPEPAYISRARSVLQS